MKVAFAYPNLTKKGKHPLLAQNRQFRYSSSSEVRIFPVIPASSVTVLKKAGHDSALIDGINTGMSNEAFERKLSQFDPDVVVLETKTPLMPRLWHRADELSERFKTIVFVGDHATALPAESLERCRVDYVVTGGDYDLSLLRLCEYLDGAAHDLPVGVWFRSEGRVRCLGPPPLWADLDQVPFTDRKLTNWSCYGEAYLQKPCVYIMTGRGCGGRGSSPGKCSFCSWQHNLWSGTCRLRSPGNVAEEVSGLVHELRPKEIFDDNESGMLWNAEWLKQFEKETRERGVLGEVAFSSNARADALTKDTCSLISRMGFRLLKIGVESGNDETLTRIGKMETASEIERGIRNAKEAGLIVLLTTMVGYPWEGSREVANTLAMARRLMRYKARLGDSLQASIIVPYPGTPLHFTAQKDGLFAIDPLDYESYDMSKPVLKSPVDVEEWSRRLWMLHFDPAFLLRCLASVRSIRDLRLARTGVSSLLGHLRDFGAGIEA